MDDLDTYYQNDFVLHREEPTPSLHVPVPELGLKKLTALRLRALVTITSALEAELLSMELDVLTGERGLEQDVNVNFYEAVESFEKNLLLATLTLERGNQTKAARRLSLGITTLNAMLKRHGIDPRMYKSVIAYQASRSPRQ